MSYVKKKIESRQIFSLKIYETSCHILTHGALWQNRWLGNQEICTCSEKMDDCLDKNINTEKEMVMTQSGVLFREYWGEWFESTSTITPELYDAKSYYLWNTNKTGNFYRRLETVFRNLKKRFTLCNTFELLLSVFHRDLRSLVREITALSVDNNLLT